MANNKVERPMLQSRCPRCSGAVSLLAPACRRCGAPNQARRVVGLASAAVLVLLLVGAGALYLASRQQSLGPETTGALAVPGAGAGAAGGAGGAGDLARLSADMAACDKLASQQPSDLRFLIIPLRAERKDMPDWQLIAAGLIGNAWMLPVDDALGGLRRGTLTIYPDEYVLNVQDPQTRAVFSWSTSVGTKSFSTADAKTLQSFRVQIQPQNKIDRSNWGAVYPRQKGTCHWVAAIVRD